MVGTLWENPYTDLTNYADDGVQGMIYNDTPNVLAVTVVSVEVNPATIEHQWLRTYQTAMLLPGDSVSYQLQSGEMDSDFGGVKDWNTELNYYVALWKPKSLYPSSDPTNDPGWTNRTQLGLYDPPIGWPSTYFIPPGRPISQPANERTGIREGESNEEIWGSVHLSVKRENDGWQVPTSQAYLDRYPNPNNPSTSDWAIFTIRIKSL